MKKGNAIKITLIISIVILVSLISFVGIYVKQANKYENIMPEYKLGMDLGEKRVVTLNVNKGTNTTIYNKEGNEVSSIPEDAEASDYTTKSTLVNAEEILNAENYKEAKRIIEKRLKEIDVTDYTIKYSEKNGDIILELPEDDTTNNAVNMLTATGKIEMVSEETEEVLLSNTHFKKSKVAYAEGESGTTVYLTIEFNKEGKQKLKEISNIYVESTEEQEAEDETSSESKKIILRMDWPNSQTGNIEYTDVITQAFESEMTDGTLQLTIGTATTNQALEDYYEQAFQINSILNSGLMQIQYEVAGNEILESEITNTQILVTEIIVVGILVIISLILVFKYKVLGLLGTISNVAMIAFLLILVRLAKVTISVSSIVSIVSIILVNTIVIIKLISAVKNTNDARSSIWKAVLDLSDILVPVLIMAVVFIFMFNEVIVAAGMIMFWGLISIIATNLLITKPLLLATSKN